MGIEEALREAGRQGRRAARTRALASRGQGANPGLGSTGCVTLGILLAPRDSASSLTNA